MARGIRPDQVSIGGPSESAPDSPTSGPVPQISYSEHLDEGESLLQEIEESHLPDEDGTNNDEAHSISTGDRVESLSSDLSVIVRRLDDGSDSSPDGEQ